MYVPQSHFHKTHMTSVVSQNFNPHRKAACFAQQGKRYSRTQAAHNLTVKMGWGGDFYIRSAH